MRTKSINESENSPAKIPQDLLQVRMYEPGNDIVSFNGKDRSFLLFCALSIYVRKKLYKPIKYAAKYGDYLDVMDLVEVRIEKKKIIELLKLTKFSKKEQEQRLIEHVKDFHNGNLCNYSISEKGDIKVSTYCFCEVVSYDTADDAVVFIAKEARLLGMFGKKDSSAFVLPEVYLKLSGFTQFLLYSLLRKWVNYRDMNNNTVGVVTFDIEHLLHILQIRENPAYNIKTCTNARQNFLRGALGIVKKKKNESVGDCWTYVKTSKGDFYGAIHSINTNTDIVVNCTPIKVKNKYVSVEFKINWKDGFGIDSMIDKVDYDLSRCDKMKSEKEKEERRKIKNHDNLNKSSDISELISIISKEVEKDDLEIISTFNEIKNNYGGAITDEQLKTILTKSGYVVKDGTVYRKR